MDIDRFQSQIANLNRLAKELHQLPILAAQVVMLQIISVHVCEPMKKTPFISLGLSSCFPKGVSTSIRNPSVCDCLAMSEAT